MRPLWYIMMLMHLHITCFQYPADDIIVCNNIPISDYYYKATTCAIELDSSSENIYGIVYINCTATVQDYKNILAYDQYRSHSLQENASSDDFFVVIGGAVTKLLQTRDFSGFERYNCKFNVTEMDDKVRPDIILKLEMIKSGYDGWVYEDDGFAVSEINIFDGIPQISRNTFAALASVKKVGVYTSLSIQPGAFNTIRELEMLIITNTTIEELPTAIFETLENIFYLILNKNKLKHWKREYFGNIPVLQQLVMLNLAANEIGTLSADSFNGMLSLKALTLTSNKIKELDDGTFGNLISLETLDLSHNKLNTWKLQYHNGTLGKLQELYLHANNIYILGAHSFSGMQNVQIINLGSNNIEDLPDNIFGMLNNLTVLALDENNLTIWNRNSGDVFERLLALHLNSNNLKSLEENAFRDMFSLELLHLSNNSIETLPNWMFVSLNQLTELYLAHNKLKVWLPQRGVLEKLKILDLNHNEIEELIPNTFSYLEDLQELYLAGNNLTTVFSNSGYEYYYEFPSYLKNLDLSYNKLNDKYILLDRPSLKTLNLEGNRFEFLAPLDLYSKRSKFEYQGSIEVNLKRNNLSVIDFDLINAVTLESRDQKLEFLIDENPIVCDCFAYNLQVALRSREEIGAPRVTADKLKCSSPPQHKGKDVKSMNPGDFNCTLTYLKTDFIPTMCSGNCTCMYFGQNKTNLAINCSNTNLNYMPTLPSLSAINRNISSKITILTISMNLSNNQIYEIRVNDGYNSVTYLDLSYNRLNTIDQLPQRIEYLAVNNNNITFLKDSIILLMENSPTLKTLKFHDNPWLCNCALTNFTNALRRERFLQIVDRRADLTCNDGKYLSLVTETDLCNQSQFPSVAVIVFFVIFLMISLIGMILFHIYEQMIKIWFYSNNLLFCWITEETLDENKEFDAFVSYAHEDEDFIRNHLVPELERGEPPFELCIHVRDWLVGEFITRQIVESVEKSRRTIIVLSKDFLLSRWAMMEFRTAHAQTMDDKRNRLIIILYGDIVPSDIKDLELKAYLTTNTYIKWGDPWFWKRLRYAMPHRMDSSNFGRRRRQEDVTEDIELRRIPINVNM